MPKYKIEYGGKSYIVEMARPPTESEVARMVGSASKSRASAPPQPMRGDMQTLDKLERDIRTPGGTKPFNPFSANVSPVARKPKASSKPSSPDISQFGIGGVDVAQARGQQDRENALWDAVDRDREANTPQGRQTARKTTQALGKQYRQQLPLAQIRAHNDQSKQVDLIHNLSKIPDQTEVQKEGDTISRNFKPGAEDIANFVPSQLDKVELAMAHKMGISAQEWEKRRRQVEKDHPVINTLTRIGESAPAYAIPGFGEGLMAAHGLGAAGDAMKDPAEGAKEFAWLIGPGIIAHVGMGSIGAIASKYGLSAEEATSVEHAAEELREGKQPPMTPELETAKTKIENHPAFHQDIQNEVLRAQQAATDAGYPPHIAQKAIGFDSRGKLKFRLPATNVPEHANTNAPVFPEHSQAGRDHQNMVSDLQEGQGAGEPAKMGNNESVPQPPAGEGALPPTPTPVNPEHNVPGEAVSPSPTINTGEGAEAAANAPEPENGTSVKNAFAERDRLAMGLDELPEHERISFEGSLKAAREKELNSPTKINSIVDQVLKGSKEHLSPEESAGIADHMVTLKADHAKTLAETNRLIDENAPLQDIKASQDHLYNIEHEFDRLTDATNKAGEKTGQALVFRKLTLNKDYDLISVLNRAKAKKGSSLSGAEREALEKQVSALENEVKSQRETHETYTAEQEAKHSRLQKDFEALQERQRSNEARGESLRGNANQRALKSKSSRERISANRETAKADLKNALENWGKGGGPKLPRNAGAIQFPEELPEAMNAIGRIARSYIEEGAQTVQDVYDGVRQAVAEHGFDIEDKQIRRAYDRLMSRDNAKPITDAMRTKARLSALLRLHSRIEQVIDQVIRPKGESAVSDLASDPEFQSLRKKLKEVTKAYGDPQNPGDPQELKFAKQLGHALDTLERVKQGKVEPTSEREGPMTPEASELQKQLKDTQAQIKTLRDAQKGPKVSERLSERELEARRLQKQIDDINAGPQPKRPESLGPEHPQITKLKAERDNLRQKIAEGKKTPETQKRLAQIQREIERIGKTQQPKPKAFGPDHPDVIQLTKRRDSLRKSYSDMKAAEKKANKPDTRIPETEIKIRRLNKQIEDLKTGKTKNPPVQGPEHPEVTKLKNELSAMREKVGKKPGTKSDADKIADLKTRIADAQKQYAGQYRNVRKIKPEEAEVVSDVRKQLRSARTDLKLDDKEAQLSRDLQEKSGAELQIDKDKAKATREARKTPSTHEQIKSRERVANLKRQIDQKIESHRPKTKAEKAISYTRAGDLTAPVILPKIIGHAVSKLVISPIESLTGLVVDKLPAGGGKTLGQVAPEAAGGGSFRMMQAALSREAGRDTLQTAKGQGHPAEIAAGQTHSGNDFASLPGRIHGAMQAPMLTGEYKVAKSKLIKQFTKDGLDVSKPEVQDLIATRAGSHALNEMMRQKNPVSETVNNALNSAARSDNPGKQLSAFFGRLIAPITQMPTNIAGRVADYGMVAPFRGALSYGDALAKAKYAKEPIPPEVAANILRAFKRGGPALVFAYIGLTKPDWFKARGFFPKDKTTKGQVTVNGKVIPKPLTQNAYIDPISFYATLGDELQKGNGSAASYVDATLNSAGPIVLTLPGLETLGRAAQSGSEGNFAGVAGDLASQAIPASGLLRTGAQAADQQPGSSLIGGHPVQRNEKGFFGPIQAGIPILRNSLPKKSSQNGPKY